MARHSPRCGDACEPPAGIPKLHLDRVRIYWSEIPGATGYDLLRGDLIRLVRSAGDFTASTRECIADDHPGSQIVDELKPPEHEGFWFLVRAVNAFGAGTYDSWGGSQPESRDAEIAASARGVSMTGAFEEIASCR